MTVRVYYSTDAGAPTLTSAVGSLANVLSKCLVEGYGSKAAAGWSKPYGAADNSIIALRQGGGANRYLRINDSAAATTSSRYTRVRGYETMSDLNTGNGPFPSPSQQDGDGFYWSSHYSGTATTPRQWVVVADETFFYLMYVNNPGAETDLNSYYRECYWFGDLNKYGPNDTYATILFGRGGPAQNSSESFPFNSIQVGNTEYMAAARSYTGLGGSVWLGKHHDYAKSGNSTWGQGALSYPHGPDGALLLSPVWIHEANALRGRLPGCWAPMQSAFNGLDTFDGQGDFAGKKFLIWKHSSARMALEISDTWR